MSLVQPITPHLWFDKQAKEAAEFYCSAFPDSKIDAITQLHDTPSGDCDVVSFTLQGQPFMAISAGPLFKFNPSVSFFVNFDPARDPINASDQSCTRCVPPEQEWNEDFFLGLDHQA